MSPFVNKRGQQVHSQTLSHLMSLPPDEWPQKFGTVITHGTLVNRRLIPRRITKNFILAGPWHLPPRLSRNQALLGRPRMG